MHPDHDDGSNEAAPPSSLPGRLTALLRELAGAPATSSPEAAALRLRAGDHVGRFEVVREIGRGGFGVVFEARDPELRRTVALKVVRPRSLTDLRQDRLMREAEAAASLSHPNIVTLFDAGVYEGGPFLVMEYLRGRTLAQRLQEGPLPVQETLRIGVEVTRALAHAHAEGIVHRDLKPANVFLCSKGQVKVLDLGLAYAFGRRPPEGGTPGFMAPEQQRGAPEDERSDVFALGVMLHWMATGRGPYPAGVTVEGTAPLVALPGCPGLGELITTLVDPDPVRRPRSASEVLPVLVALAKASDRALPAASRDTPGHRRSDRPPARRVAGLALGALLLAGGGLAAWRLAGTPAPTRQAASSIAVLPFEDLSPDRDQGYFSDGLADEILSALARVNGLHVPGRTSSFAFRGKGALLGEIGRALNVRSVLEGSVRRSGRRVRVTARVVDVADGYHRWTETYDRELTDIFAVQEEIARAVVSALGVRLLAGEEPSVKSRSTQNPEAYQAYLVGRHHLRALTKERLALGVQAFDRAISLDPTYAPAWAALGNPLLLLAGYEPDAASALALRQRALASAERAVELAPDLPEALSSRGSLRLRLRNDLAGASEDLERAVRLSGNDPDTLRRYATLLLFSGRLQEAATEARRSTTLDPLGQAWILLGTILQFSGDLAGADAAYRHHLEIAPGTTAAQFGLARNLLLQGRAAEALVTAERLADEDHQLWVRAAAEHALGHAEASREAFQRLLELRAGTRALELAQLEAWRGAPAAALDRLERAQASQAPLTADLALDPFLASLRDTPRFQALVAQVRAPRPKGDPP